MTQPLGAGRGGLHALDARPMSPRQRYAAMLVAFGEFIDGYDLLVIGGALIFLKPEFQLSPAAIGALGASGFLGAMVGLMVLMGVRPGDIALDPNGWPATVVLAELIGESVIADLLLGQVPLKARFNQTRRFAEGEPVRIGIDPSRVHLFDPSGPRIDLT